jgi:aspartyl-tRNA(Asn)/glutamyl-tRNA(Gln) amidotransferase subunit A
MNNELMQLSALKQAEYIRTKQVSAMELLEAVLSQTEKTEPVNHAFVTICEKEAREKARNVDKKIASGEPVGPLAGVPYSAKDMFCTRGIQTTAGSRILNGWLPPYSAAAIEQMDRADAVLFGKTSCDEFAMGWTNETAAVQPCPCNPHDPERVAGGSSGGSAAAVAAYESAVSLGTDTGGSIREPAAFCGVVGLKPTYGRVSRWGVIAFASSMDTVGPITRSVTDAALMMNILAGFDPRDNVTARISVPDYCSEIKKGIKGLRIGISPDFLKLSLMNQSGDFEDFTIDAEISAAIEKTAAVLESAGAEIIPSVPLPNTKYSVPAYFVISRIEAYSNLQRYDGLKYGRTSQRPADDMYDLFVKSREEGFGHEVKLRILTGLYMSRKEFYEKYYLRAQRARALIRSDYDRIFDPAGDYRLDVLLTPTTPITAFRFDRKGSDPTLIQYADQFTTPMNFAGIPGISVPVGKTSAGLPVGVQFVSNDYCEAKILRTAYAAEQLITEQCEVGIE